MGIFEKSRWQIWNGLQHPYKHTLGDFGYTNPAMPGVSTVEATLDWILKVLYPNTKPAVANVAALPAVGNTINDYRVVQDDGDGNAAGYRWEQREGEVAASWHKVFDFDWSTDSILAALYDIAQDKFVIKFGRQDLDETGTIIVGTYAGQRIYGGTEANQNLTLSANSGDGVGAQTGYVQTDATFRAVANNTYDLGTAALKWKDLYLAGVANVGTLVLASGSITDSSGTISFGDENLVTTGTITAPTMYATSSVEVGPLVGNALILAPGSITDESGAISFGNENLSTLGTVSGASGSTFGTLTLADGSITDSGGAISFGNENLSTTGTLSSGNTTVTRLDSDNVRVDGNTISILDVNGNLILQANGTGVIDLQNAATTLSLTTTGTHTITGQLNVDNLRLDGNVLSSTDLNGNITFTPNGTGVVVSSSLLRGSSDATLDLGTSALRWQRLYLSAGIHDGTTEITQSTLQSLRDINIGVAVGYTIFWNGTKWVASAPDTEVDHGTISGLLDDDHTQYMLLAGRAGGQSLVGGTAASEHITLESTAHATKGFVKTKDDLVPFTNASYSGGWSGTNLGGSSNYFKDLYTKGELRGARIENFTFAGLPAASAQNVGRLFYTTDTTRLYVDTGSTLKLLSYNKFQSDTVWNGSDTTKDVDVSASIVDARTAIWQLCDNSNDYERIYTSIKAISATTVRITVSPALTAGSYRLIGIE